VNRYPLEKQDGVGVFKDNKLAAVFSVIENRGGRGESSRVLSSGTRRQASVRIEVFMPMTLDVGRRFDYSTS
jgi:hypothetical protein